VLPTVTSFAGGSGSDVITMQGRGGSPLSPQHQRQLRAVQQGWLGNASVPEDASQDGLSPGERLRLLTADDDDQAETLSQATGPIDAVGGPTDLTSAT
jgi:hypothetical protein